MLNILFVIVDFIVLQKNKYKRADEARAESLLILEQLSSIQNERLRLTLHTPQVEFTSEEALKFLNGFQSNVVQQGNGNNNNNGGGGVDDDSETMGIMGRMGFKHTLREDIDTFRVAEEEFRTKLQEKQDIDYKQDLIIKELERAEKNTRDAEMVCALFENLIALLFISLKIISYGMYTTRK